MKKYIHCIVNNDKNISPFSRKCLDSFKDYLTDYEIRYWTVDDIAKIDDDMAVEISKIDSYALKKIFLEIYVIYQYGGIYIDQNLELIAPIDDLLEESNSFLGLDERHHISSSIWYEKNAKSYLATKVYEKFKEYYTEALYDNYFVNLPFLFREILTDYRPEVTEIQKLKHGITLYSYDYFYPLSYDGHTKNKSENTRMLNYFNYDFITPKGKLKNSCYTIFGEGISQKLFSIFSILKKALKFILKPLFAYKEYKRKNDEKHKELVKTTLDKLKKYKNKDYVAFHNPEWTGVSNATIELFENSIPCGELISRKEIKEVCNAIINNNIKEVIFSGFCIGWYKLAIALYNEGVVVKTYFHGSHTQYLDEYGWKMNDQIYALERKGIVKEMAFCKESIIDFYKDKGCNVTFLRNLVNIDYNIKKVTNKSDEFKIGIYAVQPTQFRKNVFSSLASVYFIKQKLKDKKVVVDVVPNSDSVAAFCHFFDIEVTGIYKGVPREELLKRMSKCDITLYVTFSECAPMLPLESFYVGVPCITGNNHHYFKNTELEKYLVVNNEDNALEISDKVIMCINNKDKVLSLYDKFSKSNLKEGQKLVRNFLSIEGDKHE